MSSSLRRSWIQTAMLGGLGISGMAGMSFVNMYDLMGLGLHLGTGLQISLAAVMAAAVNTIVPRKKIALKEEFKVKIENLKIRLENILSNRVSHEIGFVSERILGKKKKKTYIYIYILYI